MSNALKFLYGVALGISLGIIGARLTSSASMKPSRRSRRWNGRFRAAVRLPTRQMEKEEVTPR